MRALVMALLWPFAAWAEGEQAGDFDYYVLSLSWSPTWCALEGDARGSPQCDDDAGFGWVLHGLWPQNERGWPSYCRTGVRDPSRRDTDAMADIMGSGGSAWHQWKKHGRCSGLTSDDFFAVAREAYSRVTRPDIFRKLERDVKLPAAVVEQAFLEENETWEADGVTITCKSGRIQEARVCLTRGLEPRVCGVGVVRDCAMSDALFESMP